MTEKKKPTFLRRKNQAYSKLGLRRKKKQVWRKPTGRDNKMREKRKGFPVVVSIGYGSSDKKKLVVVNNLKDLENVKVKEVVIGNVGKKKRQEIIAKANEKKIKILNRYLKEDKKSSEEKQ